MKKKLMQKPFLSLFLGVFLFLGLFLGYAVQAPDIDLSFQRTVPSSLDPSRIDRNIAAVNRWPQWFHSVKEVQSLDQKDLHPGSQLKIKVDPGKGRKKAFELLAEVIEYVPAKKLRMKILDDSTGRLTLLFDQLEWNIDITPQGDGSLLQGRASARTKNWRSRLFGHFCEKILMNQIFYPNLIHLSEMKQPFSIEPKRGNSSLFN